MENVTRTTLDIEALKTTELFRGKYASSNRWTRSVSGGWQYVTEETTRSH